MRWRPGTTGSSPAAAEQLGHDVFVRPRAGTSLGDPLVMGREGGLDLCSFQSLRRGVPLHRAEPPKLRKRDHGGCLAAEVDHLVRLVWVRMVGRLRTHTINRTGLGSGGAGATADVKQVNQHRRRLTTSYLYDCYGSGNSGDVVRQV